MYADYICTYKIDEMSQIVHTALHTLVAFGEVQAYTQTEYGNRAAMRTESVFDFKKWTYLVKEASSAVPAERERKGQTAGRCAAPDDQSEMHARRLRRILGRLPVVADRDVRVVAKVFAYFQQLVMGSRGAHTNRRAIISA